ncbi:uncharacterized protein TEOVI_000429300 [Trypanosoma equiperdum]|uniref:Uncharacterized protein n=3 Tax=Trypanozoon TaxID=39700 RepID=C9ZTL1_TRYB9|nr:hypothetical protein, conserved [Trypanosoma brucei gambiense DAL972]RHW71254.1 hypothetical protein DPX39_070065900 [Trypanosoma brucei equiperdum]CBH12746.1 hypothetical protein, conserved [Trypanosoma brucei gambiense DAL972]SCU72715.1 hypothetical protein, conserved [Trypanosoma equiperdum]|eukprot:XP_011775026.1 hypothetical protein, conserved [Trypanosoma brucei gambiense DAL972]
MILRGRVGAVFIDISIRHDGPIDMLDFFNRSWNVELTRNAASEATGCLLRFPLLKVGSSVCAGVVASLNTEGLLRLVCSSTVDNALAVADYVFEYVKQRLPTPVCGSKSIVFFQFMFRLKQQGVTGKIRIDTSNESVQWFENHIATAVANGVEGRQGRWWAAITKHTVIRSQHQGALRIACHFKQPAPWCEARALEETSKGDERDADNFFASEMMSVIPMGSVFVAMPHNREVNPEVRLSSLKRLQSEEGEGVSMASSLWQPQTEVETKATPQRGSDGGEAVEVLTGNAATKCPTVVKPQLKVEVTLRHTGYAVATADTQEGLSFFVEEVLIPFLHREK